MAVEERQNRNPYKGISTTSYPTFFFSVCLTVTKSVLLCEYCQRPELDALTGSVAFAVMLWWKSSVCKSGRKRLSPKQANCLFLWHKLMWPSPAESPYWRAVWLHNAKIFTVCNGTIIYFIFVELSTSPLYQIIPFSRGCLWPETWIKKFLHPGY